MQQLIFKASIAAEAGITGSGLSFDMNAYGSYMQGQGMMMDNGSTARYGADRQMTDFRNQLTQLIVVPMLNVANAPINLYLYLNLFNKLDLVVQPMLLGIGRFLNWCRYLCWLILGGSQ